MNSRNIVSLPESLKIIQERAQNLRRSTETIPVRTAADRVAAVLVYAKFSNPEVPVAAMDGIAIDYRSASSLPARLQSIEWKRINTGEPLPETFNAVVKIENVQWEDEIPVLQNKVEFFQNVRHPGEDFSGGTLLILPDDRLQPQDLSLLLSAGHEQIEVYRKPVVTFLPTGSELILDSSQKRFGKVLESNSAMIAGMVDSWNAILHFASPIADDPDLLVQKIKSYASKTDILVVSAGTSKGLRDLTADALHAAGTVYFDGVVVNPSRPVLYAEVGTTPVLGLPGYPVAAYIAAYLYLRPLVCALSGSQAVLPQKTFVSAEDLPAKEGDHFYRVQVYEVEGQFYARKISRGAGSVLSLSQMDGLMHVPPHTPIKKRDAVRIDVVQDRSQKAILVRGISDSLLFHLFDLSRAQIPSERILFSEAPAEEALQNILERNSHLAVISTPAGGVDIFPGFSKQLQERMLRYRLFTRTVGLCLGTKAAYPNLDSIPKGIRLALPRKNISLWDQFRFVQKLDESKFQPTLTMNEEISLIESLEKTHWDAVFADIRFLTEGQYSLVTVQEHIDLVVPESYSELGAVRKLIELLLSEEFAGRVTSQKGCDLRSRGLIGESQN